MQNRFKGNNHPPFAQIKQDTLEDNSVDPDFTQGRPEFIRVFHAFPYYKDNSNDELKIMFSAPIVWLNIQQIEFVEEFSFNHGNNQYPLSKITTLSGHIFYVPGFWCTRHKWNELEYLNNHTDDTQEQFLSSSVNIDMKSLGNLLDRSSNQNYNEIPVDADDPMQDDSYDGPPEMFPSDEDTGFFIPDT